MVRKDKRVMARLIPPVVSGRTKRPDFLARLKKIHKNRPLAVSGAELLAAERDRY
jgi:hypothetical protein